MSCQQVREFLDAYIDKELDVVKTFEFDRHLAECLTCRSICEQYQELHDSVQRRIPYFEIPDGLQGKLLAQLRPVGRDQDVARRKAWFPHWRGWAAAAAMSILLALSAVLFWTIGRPAVPEMLAEQAVSSHIRSLMANHLFDVASSDQHTVKPWFSGKLDFAPVVKDLSAQGFPLVGGRLDYLDNRPVAALVYKRRQHTINLFLWPSPDSDSKPRTVTLKGFNVVHGTQSHMSYWAVSDLNAGELNEFVHQLEK